MRSLILWTALIALLTLATVGCRTNRGAQEFIPGRGWVPTR